VQTGKTIATINVELRRKLTGIAFETPHSLCNLVLRSRFAEGLLMLGASVATI
jgi:hypothetical protein